VPEEDRSWKMSLNTQNRMRISAVYLKCVSLRSKLKLNIAKLTIVQSSVRIALSKDQYKNRSIEAKKG
jgi:hypothetical protein